MRDALRRLILRFPGALRLDCWLRARKHGLRGAAELRMACHLADPDRLTVDVGANKGYITYWLQRYSRHVLAFEPDPHNLFFLRAIRGNVTVRPFGLSNQTGMATFRVHKRPIESSLLRLLGVGYVLEHQCGTFAAAQPGREYQETSVEIRRLDDEVREPVGFIKIDVEGHELAVLKGAQRVLAKDRPYMLIEVEQRHNQRPTPEVLAEIEAMGYLAYGLHRQRLVRATQLDPARHFRPESGRDYVNNFVFLPQ